ncbi:hypothetical protein EPICR_30055 [Candidatus Desulfarcum epimagneticum]|uniref:PAS domain-containing protein n=1 Tax=uncultured Desulfobacteraceae bacterium TaxID=218296 RepID=A0A484HI77_9BACT|nr:hypothetical protein EPICR_30055 [uncultured Desulfobacteraceae bacterium]
MITAVRVPARLPERDVEMIDNQNYKQFEAILNSISDGVFTTDPNCNIAYFNKAAERMTGVSREGKTSPFLLSVSGGLKMSEK